jgi:hypothetical protein
MKEEESFKEWKEEEESVQECKDKLNEDKERFK